MTAQTDMKFEVIDSSAEEDSEDDDLFGGVQGTNNNETAKPE